MAVIPTKYHMERSLNWHGVPVLAVGRIQLVRGKNDTQVRSFSIEIHAPADLINSLPLDSSRPEFHPSSARMSYMSTRFVGESAGVWRKALSMIRGRKVEVSGPEKYAWKHPRVQALLTPSEPSERVTASELAALFELESGALPNTNFTANVSEMGDRRTSDVNRTFMAFLKPVLQVVHPKDPEGVLRSVINSNAFQQKFLWPHLNLSTFLLDSPFFAGMISSYKSAVAEGKSALHPDARRAAKQRAVQLLSLVAPHFPYAVIQELFQCCDRAVLNARLHAAHNGGGAYEEKKEKRLYKSRVPVQTLLHFREFRSRDDVVTTVAYTRADKTKTVEKWQLQEGVQDLMRKYFRECKLLGVDKPISPSAFEKIFYNGEYINKTARTCVCHQDLFYGTENFEAIEISIISVTDSLCDHVAKLSSNNTAGQICIPLATSHGVTSFGLQAIHGLRASLLAMLNRISTYFRTDFNVHAQLDSPCATHCIRYALSSSGDPRFQSACSHEHSMLCGDCNLAVHFFKDLQLLLASAVNLSVLKPADVDRLTFALEECEAHFSKYVSHRVRTIHQNSAPGLEIALMGYTEAFIIMDYMNKWLPFEHRATTSDAFGQAGESVHGATVYVRALPDTAKRMIAAGDVEDARRFLRELPVDTAGDINRWYVLLGSANDHKQDQWHAASVTEATLKIVQELEPQVDLARLRFDHATCYHGTLYWLLLSIMEKASGIKVTEVGMNESGEGKDETDSSFNTAKAYVKRLVHNGLDANTAVEFIAALNTSEGIVGMIARVIEIVRPVPSIEVGTLDQITRFSHIRHEDDGLRCWEQYDIGPGRLFTCAELKKLVKVQLPETTELRSYPPQEDTNLCMPLRPIAALSSRDADQDVLKAINAVSAPQKQLRLDQVTSWFSRRYSKYVLEAKNARVNAELERALTSRASNASVVTSVVTDMVQEVLKRPISQSSWLQSEVAEMEIDTPEVVDQEPEPTTSGAQSGVAEMTDRREGRLEAAQRKQTATVEAASAKRKALYDMGREHFNQLQGLLAAGRMGVVKKLKVDSLKGLLMFFQDQSDEIPPGKKPEQLTAVMSHVREMPLGATAVTQTPASNVERQAVATAAIVSPIPVLPSQPEQRANITTSVTQDMDVDAVAEVSLSETEQNDLVLRFLEQFRV
ncbi:hypothetical protein CYMTET_12869 [Cymbomonas tetramitiformis]|uniref:Uncharacterized protein n=1 Tax=Cymbomonas tetramitiformis TaxID=36881 RepID=A0AAE0LBL4_9CHLO|nr:hypothetical protein CYMTET_12869 [Cymbomonas tetramitiformis]